MFDSTFANQNTYDPEICEESVEALQKSQVFIKIRPSKPSPDMVARSGIRESWGAG
jgi:hypothetical protein